MCSEYFYGRHRLHIFESIVHSKILILLITFFHFFLWDTKGGYITWVAFMKSWRSHLQILYKLFMGDFQSFLQGSVQPVFCTWVKTLHADLACVQVGNVHWPTESCLIWNWCLCELSFIYFSLLKHHQCAASTWMMRRLPQYNGASALTTHQLQVERRESHRANQVDGDY